MLRTHLAGLAVAIALVDFATQAARANLYLDVQYASGGAAGSSAYSAVVTAPNQNILLNVYALITDAAPSASVDLFKEIAGSFFVASSALEGDVSFGSWNSANTNTGYSVAGQQFTSTYGGLGLGGSAATSSTTSTWWIAFAANYPAADTGGTLYTPPGASSPVGVEYLLGGIDVKFDHGLPTSSTTAPLAAIAINKLGLSSRAYAWSDSTTSSYALFGSASQVGVSGSNAGYNLLYSSSGAGLSFVFTSNVNIAAISATLGISGPTTLLGGTTTSLTGSVTNSAASPANPLNWAAAAPGVVSLNIAGSNGVAAQASNTLTGTVLATSAGFGPWATNVTFSGTDATAGTAAVGSPIAQTLNFSIIGKNTWQAGGADGNGIAGGPYGNTVTTQGTLASGYNMAGLTSTLGTAATSFGIGQTSAAILVGTLATSSTGITEQWRSRASNELLSYTSTHGGASAGLLPLFSDVVNVSGITGGSNSEYEMQVTYDPATLGGTAAAAQAASNGFLYLGYRTTAGGIGNDWTNAVSTQYADGNTAAGAGAVQDYQGSYAAFTAGPGSGFTLAQTLGSYGVDTATNTVWAIIDHDAEFAAVPEPGTIGLLVAGIAALGFAYRRRKDVRALFA
jgi:hypothetical protein